MPNCRVGYSAGRDGIANVCKAAFSGVSQYKTEGPNLAGAETIRTIHGLARVFIEERPTRRQFEELTAAEGAEIYEGSFSSCLSRIGPGPIPASRTGS